MLYNHNRKRLVLAWKIISILVVVSMLLFTIAPIFR